VWKFVVARRGETAVLGDQSTCSLYVLGDLLQLILPLNSLTYYVFQYWLAGNPPICLFRISDNMSKCLVTSGIQRDWSQQRSMAIGSTSHESRSDSYRASLDDNSAKGFDRDPKERW